MTIAPEISVVMAARNAEATIREAVESIVAQDFAAWELIVVDDGSTDGTRSIVESIADPRVRLILPERPGGAARARNLAIAAAAAPLVAIADADDVSLPERLGAQVRAFQEDPDLGVLGAQLVEFGTWGERDGAGRFPTDSGDIERLFASGRMGIAHPAAAFRTRLALALGGYDDALPRSEDLALFLRMRPVTMRALPERLVRYRVAERAGLRYVWREVRYARLAVARASGTVPRHPAAVELVLTTVSALRSWGVRRLREAVATFRSA